MKQKIEAVRGQIKQVKRDWESIDKHKENQWSDDGQKQRHLLEVCQRIECTVERIWMQLKDILDNNKAATVTAEIDEDLCFFGFDGDDFTDVHHEKIDGAACSEASDLVQSLQNDPRFNKNDIETLHKALAEASLHAAPSIFSWCTSVKSSPSKPKKHKSSSISAVTVAALLLSRMSFSCIQIRSTVHSIR